MTKTNYQSAIERINKANTVEELKKLDKSLTRLYNCGMFTEKEYRRLDLKLTGKQIKIENNS